MKQPARTSKADRQLAQRQLREQRALVAMSGSSSFKVGAACYILHGVTGQCSATTLAPRVEPAAVATTISDF